MLIVQLLKGELTLEKLKTSDKIHNAVIGFLSFGFIAAGLSAQFADSSNAAIILVAAACGGFVGKCIVI